MDPLAKNNPGRHTYAANLIHAAWEQVHGKPAEGRQALYTQAIALLETGYGRIGQFEKWAAEGKYNWGALQTRPNKETGECPAKTVPGNDQGSVCFYVFPSDLAAAKEYIKQLTLPYGSDAFRLRRGGTRDAMISGSPYDVAKAMRTPPSIGWYEGKRGAPEEDRVNYYATAIANALGTLSKNGVTDASPPAVTIVVPGGQRVPATLPSNILPLLVAAGVLGGAVFLMQKGRFPVVRLPRFG